MRILARRHPDCSRSVGGDPRPAVVKSDDVTAHRHRLGDGPTCGVVHAREEEDVRPLEALDDILPRNQSVELDPIAQP